MPTASRPASRLARRDPAPADDVEALVRRLAAALRADPGGADEGDEQVVLEVEVGGTRYALVRRPLAALAQDVVLSPREAEIGRLVAKGYVNKTIAGILDISGYTVDTYIRRLFAKLNVTTRAAMVAKLIESGLLPAGPLVRGEAEPGVRRI